MNLRNAFVNIDSKSKAMTKKHQSPLSKDDQNRRPHSIRLFLLNFISYCVCERMMINGQSVAGAIVVGDAVATTKK